MLSYAKIKDKPRVFTSFTGLTLQAFAKLLPAFRQAYEQALEQRDAQRPTPRQPCEYFILQGQRRRGGGRKSALLTIEDKLVFILFYFKLYPIQEVMGYFFGFGQPQANEWIHRLTSVLNAALGYEKKLPARKAADMEQILAECLGLEFIMKNSRWIPPSLLGGGSGLAEGENPVEISSKALYK